MELILNFIRDIQVYVLVGFIAQLIDGTLGMAYGVSANSFLLAFGIPPSVASASVHAAEVFTTGVSGYSHHYFGNVNRDLVRRLIIPGVIGAVAGAYILASISGDTIKPFVAAYLLVMGLLILYKSFHRPKPQEAFSKLVPLGLAGGFLDAIGGGGWGPIVVSTLVARGNPPRHVIGSVNLAEFFVALAASITFFLTIGLGFWQAIVGLAIGGAIAAPLAAFFTKHAPTRLLMFLVGLIICFLSLRTLYMTFF